MPERDPAEWFRRFFEVHMARFPGQPWPEEDSAAFAELVLAWVHHFRAQKVTQRRANAASLALMTVRHFPNNHLAEFFAAMPEAPVEYHTPEPEGRTHWTSGLKVWPEPRRRIGGDQ